MNEGNFTSSHGSACLRLVWLWLVLCPRLLQVNKWHASNALPNGCFDSCVHDGWSLVMLVRALVQCVCVCVCVCVFVRKRGRERVNTSCVLVCRMPIGTCVHCWAANCFNCVHSQLVLCTNSANRYTHTMACSHSTVWTCLNTCTWICINVHNVDTVCQMWVVVLLKCGSLQ